MLTNLIYWNAWLLVTMPDEGFSQALRSGLFSATATDAGAIKIYDPFVYGPDAVADKYLINSLHGLVESGTPHVSFSRFRFMIGLRWSMSACMLI